MGVGWGYALRPVRSRIAGAVRGVCTSRDCKIPRQNVFGRLGRRPAGGGEDQARVHSLWRAETARFVGSLPEPQTDPLLAAVGMPVRQTHSEKQLASSVHQDRRPQPSFP
jgi:hypothetical protein